MFSSAASRLRLLILSVWAAGLIALLVVGRYTLFIRAELWPLLLASLAIVLLFLWAMLVRPAERGKIKAATLLRGGMLVLPLLYMAPFFTKAGASGLNSFALEKRSMDDDSALAAIPIGPSAGPAAVAAGNGKVITLGYLHLHRHDLVGQHVLVDGRVSREDGTPAGQMVLYRFVIVCCAADAMPVAIHVTNPKAGTFANDSWVRVSGTVRMDTVGTRQVPVLVADGITAIPAPDDPYLSPYHF